jgi:hypothetical protein
MNDRPTHPSILTWKLLTVSQEICTSKLFLDHRHHDYVAGLKPNGGYAVDRRGNQRDKTAQARATRHSDAIGRAYVDAAADLVTNLKNAVPRHSRSSQRADEYSLARYSRDEIAVVNGAMGSSKYRPPAGKTPVNCPSDRRLTGTATPLSAKTSGAGGPRTRDQRITNPQILRAPVVARFYCATTGLTVSNNR